MNLHIEISSFKKCHNDLTNRIMFSTLVESPDNRMAANNIHTEMDSIEIAGFECFKAIWPTAIFLNELEFYNLN